MSDGAARSRGDVPPPNGRILIVKLSSLGDLFHALPAAHLVRKHTGATIDWACHDIYADLVRCFSCVSGVLPFPRSAFVSHARSFVRRLREERYELALDLQGLMKSALVAKAARAERRIGPSFCREGSRVLYDAVSGPTDKNRHAVEENLDTVRFLGLPVDEIAFPVAFPAFGLNLPRPRIGILPRSRREEKNWPVERFGELAREIRAKTGASIVLLGGRGDAPACDEIVGAAGPGAVSYAGRTSMVQLGGLIRDLDLLVTVDSGPMHIAAAVGTRTVAIFGPTLPLRTGPYGPGHVVVREGDNLDALRVQPVLDAVLRALPGTAV